MELLAYTDGRVEVRTDFEVERGSKKGTGNSGYADLVWDDGDIVWIWEVKSEGQASQENSA